jgi:hypothetical protein
MYVHRRHPMKTKNETEMTTISSFFNPFDAPAKRLVHIRLSHIQVDNNILYRSSSLRQSRHTYYLYCILSTVHVLGRPALLHKIGACHACRRLPAYYIIKNVDYFIISVVGARGSPNVLYKKRDLNFPPVRRLLFDGACLVSLFFTVGRHYFHHHHQSSHHERKLHATVSTDH